MTTNNLFDFIKYHKIKCLFLNTKEKKAFISKLISLADGKKLHYLWDNFNSESFITQIKISCDPCEYREKLEEILPLGKYILTIDDICFSDTKEPIVIEADGKEIISILTEFYWELDEVYISDYSSL